MWVLAAAFGPVGWVVAAVGTAATVYAATSGSDEYETTTYSNKSEKEAEVVKKTKTEKYNKIYQDIKAYKNKQVKRFKDKYDVDIKFYGTESKRSLGINSIALNSMFGLARTPMAQELHETDPSGKISVNKNTENDTISILEQETEDMIKLIGELEVTKFETIN